LAAIDECRPVDTLPALPPSSRRYAPRLEELGVRGLRSCPLGDLYYFDGRQGSISIRRPRHDGEIVRRGVGICVLRFQAATRAIGRRDDRRYERAAAKATSSASAPSRCRTAVAAPAGSASKTGSIIRPPSLHPFPPPISSPVPPPRPMGCPVAPAPPASTTNPHRYHGPRRKHVQSYLVPEGCMARPDAEKGKAACRV
jgi:hypothetical protein